MRGIASISLESVGHVWSDRTGERTVLTDVTLSVERGEVVSVSGASGTGKSTLLSIAGTLTRPTHGRVFLGETYAWGLSEVDLASLRGQGIAFVFQHAELIASLSVRDNVALPLLIAGCPRQEAHARAHDALEELELAHRIGASPMRLSGGERRRVALARAFAVSPSFILADEPTGDLDPAAAALVTAAFARLAERGCGIVIVTHDPALASFAMRRHRLVEGRIVDA